MIFRRISNDCLCLVMIGLDSDIGREVFVYARTVCTVRMIVGGGSSEKANLGNTHLYINHESMLCSVYVLLFFIDFGHDFDIIVIEKQTVPHIWVVLSIIFYDHPFTTVLDGHSKSG